MPTLPSGLSDQVADGEDIVRFLTSSSHYKRDCVKPRAFLPEPEKQETSVSRHGCEPVGRLHQIGLVAAGERTLHGAAFLTAQHIRTCALAVEADEPPDFHAAIRRWPDDADPLLQKAKQMERATELAAAAQLYLFP
jgi:hypothetical protein